MPHHDHVICKCVCGIVIAQCRCITPNKQVEIVEPCTHVPEVIQAGHDEVIAELPHWMIYPCQKCGTHHPYDDEEQCLIHKIQLVPGVDPEEDEAVAEIHSMPDYQEGIPAMGEIDQHDHKGFSEEKCVRCGWVMGRPPLNCMNDDTPHRFPSQMNIGCGPSIQTCPKCGVADILVRWHWSCDDYWRSEAMSRYLLVERMRCDRWDEHLHYTCRACTYDWTGPTRDQVAE